MVDGVEAHVEPMGEIATRLIKFGQGLEIETVASATVVAAR